MQKIKYMLGAVSASLALIFGFTASASAQANTNCFADDGVTVIACPATNVDDSITLGDCAIYNEGDADADADATSTSTAAGVGTAVGDGNSQSSSSNSSADANANASVNNSTDCSTNNHHVTHVTNHHVTTHAKARGHGAGHARAQVSQAPVGGAKAGAGGAIAPSFQVVAGLIGSLGTAGLGLALRNRLQ